ncbi:hypothetical protein B0T22DRAFT_533486 [Podospora appendiculata]|uniref:Hydantoinase n=1 Tax=Podospora appendiculata TaxID=314037 RepID=A0AAE1CH46_9PEZI|nr:hypothetical protein B0T22DRAFT_533486 [Podospora appendiculata]
MAQHSNMGSAVSSPSSSLMTEPRRLRIGVDVGGTNTDGVILDPLRASEEDKGIAAWHKAPTTTNPSDGIRDTISTMLIAAHVSPADIASITIGTTQFVNAVVERDARRLSRVAIIRLSGPFSKHAPPCVDWPEDLRALILGYYALVKGGLEVDGNLISDINEAEIRAQCSEIRARGISSVVVNGIFSPIDTVEKQEERAASIIKNEIPGCDVVCSKEVANLGFLERENAAILNASILRFARKTIRSFQEPVRKLGLTCPVFITQNDGTILSGEMASRLPIRTFSSGPTNSMRGAAFLTQDQTQSWVVVDGDENDEPMMVVDIGGTTTDVGLLLPNGFPRQQAAYSELAGVRMNFSCPDIKSIGLGGGSIVRKGDRMTIGPDSVGHRLIKDSILFGGKILTATDCAVAINPSLKIGNPELVKGILTEEEIETFKSIIKSKLEKVIDTMKTSPEDLTVILVGGGAIIAPDKLEGASKVLKPQFSAVANAIGAAIARVSAVIDTVRSTESKTSQQVLDEISKEAIRKAIKAGAAPESVKIVEMDTLPLQYIANKSRFIVRAAGDFDLSRTDLITVSAAAEDFEFDGDADIPEVKSPIRLGNSITKGGSQQQPSIDDILTYRPDVRERVWYVSETDLTWISTGCYILGTGGGGSPYPHMILLRQLLRAGAVVRVVSPEDVADEDAVGCGCGAGSPTVAIEKLQGDEMMEAQNELYKICEKQATHMIALEIGGGNGLQGMSLGSSANMNIPCVDGDWMGRAYPTKWQTTPVVFNERSPIWSPIAIADGNGNVVIMPKAASDLQVERIMRVALSEMGSQVACADPPVSGAEMKRWVVEHTISQSWRIGRAVAKARLLNRVDNVAETIIEECGGHGAAKVLFKGKIVGVERTLKNGYVYGECIIEGSDVADTQRNVAKTNDFQGRRVKIPFKNENIAAIRIPKSEGDGDEKKDELEKQEDVLAIVPDLISVIDAQNGEAVGTPEYRYGLLVIVLGIAASDKWTGSERGVELGGPKAFGFNHLEFTPLGKFVKPASVIDEFDKSR